MTMGLTSRPSSKLLLIPLPFVTGVSVVAQLLQPNAAWRIYYRNNLPSAYGNGADELPPPVDCSKIPYHRHIFIWLQNCCNRTPPGISTPGNNQPSAYENRAIKPPLQQAAPGFANAIWDRGYLWLQNCCNRAPPGISTTGTINPVHMKMGRTSHPSSELLLISLPTPLATGASCGCKMLATKVQN